MTDFIDYQELRVRVIRTARRKSLGLTVRDGEAIVRMPKRLALRHAESFIAQKADWLRIKLADHPAPAAKLYQSGESFLFLGEHCLLNICLSQSRHQVVLLDGEMTVSTRSNSLEPESIKKQLTRWYRAQAEAYLTERVHVLSEQTGLQPASVQVRQYKARWGSCKITGDIQLNWKLIMAQPAVIDYVIIHELCHLKQHNHSPAFWALVENFEPRHQQYRQWLKQHHADLNLD